MPAQKEDVDTARDAYYNANTGDELYKSDVIAKTAATGSTDDVSGTLTVDFDRLSGTFHTLNLVGDTTLASSNLRSGSWVTFRIVADGTERTLAFPAGWTFVGAEAPASIAADKVGILAVQSFGISDASVVAAYAVEA